MFFVANRYRCSFRYCRDIFDAMFPVISAPDDVIIQQGAFLMFSGVVWRISGVKL